MSGDRVCPNCGAVVKPAMLKCFDCGTRMTEQMPQSDAVATSGTNGRTVNSSPRIVGASQHHTVGKNAAVLRGQSTVAARPIRPAATAPATPASAPEPTAGDAPRRPVKSSNANRDSTDTADAGDGVLIEQCACGNRMRVPRSWTGRQKKCRRCGAVLLLGSGVTLDATETSSDRNSESAEELNRLIEELVSQIEKHPEQSSLTRQISGRRLTKFAQQLTVTDPLSREEAMQRRAAAIELGRTRDTRAVEILNQAQQDNWEAVRQGVASALGELADPAAVPLALSLLKDSAAEVVRETVNALRAIGDPRVVPILLWFGQRDAALRLQVREAIVGMGEVAVPKLVEATQGNHAALVRESVTVLGRIRDPRANASLLNTLDRSDGATRLAVIEALGRIGDPQSAGALIALLNEDDERFRMAATVALTHVPDSRAVRPLMALLQQTQNVELRRNAIRALAATKDPRAVPTIARQLEHADNDLSETIAEALGVIGTTAACGPLIRLLRTDNHAVLLKAIGALRKVATDDAVEALIPLVQHANPSVRRQTVEVLGDLRPADAFDLFAELLTDDASFEVRSAAARGLGKLRDEHGISLLEQALRDESTVRCAAIMGLTTIGNRSCIPALLAMLRDPTPVVRYHAVTGLGKLRADQATGAIRQLLEDKDSMVRTGAEKALSELGISKPTVSVQRRLASGMSRLLPDNLVGVVPGGVITVAAVPVLLVMMGSAWLLARNSLPTGELAVAQALFSTAEVADVAWLSKSERVALIRTDGTLDVWNAATGDFDKRLKLDTPIRLASAAAASPGNLVVFTPGARSRVGIWNVEQGADSARQIDWAPFDGRIQSAMASGDGSILLAVTGPATTVIWNVNEKSPLATIPFKNRPHPALSNDGSLAAGVVWQTPDPKTPAVGKAVLCIYSTATGEVLSELDPESLPGIQELVFDESGDKLFATTREGMIPVALTDGSSAIAGKPIAIPPLRHLNSAGPSKMIGVNGTRVSVLDSGSGKATTINISAQPGMKSVDCRDGLASADGRRLLVAGEESKSAWLVDLTSGESTELSPVQIPADVRQPQQAN